MNAGESPTEELGARGGKDPFGGPIREVDVGEGPVALAPKSDRGGDLKPGAGMAPDRRPVARIDDRVGDFDAVVAVAEHAGGVERELDAPASVRGRDVGGIEVDSVGGGVEGVEDFFDPERDVDGESHADRFALSSQRKDAVGMRVELLPAPAFVHALLGGDAHQRGEQIIARRVRPSEADALDVERPDVPQGVAQDVMARHFFLRPGQLYGRSQKASCRPP